MDVCHIRIGCAGYGGGLWDGNAAGTVPDIADRGKPQRRAIFTGDAPGLSAPTLSNDPPRYNIQPGQEVVTLTPSGFQKKRWGIIPVGRVNARGRPVMETIINARSETVFRSCCRKKRAS